MENDGITLDELKKQLGADRIEVIEPEKDILQQASELQQKRTQRIKGLLSGEITPPNDFIAYQVKSIQENDEELKQLAQVLSELQTRTQQLKNRAHEIQVEQNKALRDIQHFDTEGE